MDTLRWPNGEVVGPHCGVIGSHYYLNLDNGVSRTTTRDTVPASSLEAQGLP